MALGLGSLNGVTVQKTSTIQIITNKPTSIKPVYVKQYYVKVVGGSGTGWYDKGTKTTISAKQYIPSFPFDKLFDKWTDEKGHILSISNTEVIKVDKPLTLYAVYRNFPLILIVLAIIIFILLAILIIKKRNKQRKITKYQWNYQK